MERLSGAFAGCRAVMRLGLAQWLGEGVRGTDYITGLVRGMVVSVLVSPKIYMSVEGETGHKHENMNVMHFTDRSVV